MWRRSFVTGRRRLRSSVVVVVPACVLFLVFGEHASEAAHRRKKAAPAGRAVPEQTPASPAEPETSAADPAPQTPARGGPAGEKALGSEKPADEPQENSSGVVPESPAPAGASVNASGGTSAEIGAGSNEESDAGAWLWRAYPAIPAPALRGLQASSRLYLDASVVRSRDLSALPYISGSGINYRTAFGGSWARGGFQLDGEITFAQSTTITVTEVPGGMPIPEDRTQTATSLGDSYLGASWSSPLSDWPVQLGASLRAKIPTHTTIFQFHLIDGSIGRYPFPYYFHIEPAFLGAAGWGPLSLAVNTGPLVLIGPDGNFADLHIVVPTLWFWDSHLALALALGRHFGLSTEFVATVLTSQIDQPEFAKLNGLKAFSVNPGVQLRFDRFQVDLVGRWGLNKGAEAFGVIVFSGTQGVLLRVSFLFE